MDQRQAVRHGADQAVLHRLAELDINLAGSVEDFRVKPVEGEHAYADRTPPLGQPPRGAGLQVGRHNDARNRRQVTAGIASAGQDRGGLTRGGGGEVEVARHVFSRT